MNKNANRWKKIVYEYDLISGKVNKVMYQPRYSDQFTHRYLYDAENRLTEVYTSLDGFTWEREAKYEYYLHGPLARTVLGQQQVQGMDYAYTLQGWLKGVNSTGATATHDIGADGQLSSLNQYVARDALGFNLNYFHGDYLAINPGVNPFPSYRTPSNGLPDTEYRPLYNGNISSMVSYIRKFEAVNHNVPIFYNYRYDQLNRYVRQDSYFGFNKATNTYGAWTPDSTFRERVAYDANGNIQTFVRHAINQGGALMDNLTYKYYPGTNQLRQVNDVVADNSYGTNPSNPVVDIDNQTDTSNYVYDAIGNLIQDKAEKITNIQWNVYGKITEITRNSLTTDRVTTTRTRYTYDAQGNRISKAVKSYKTANSRYEIDYTWYVRDAQGNLLSTYTANAIDTSGNNLEALTLKQEDVQVYGSSRLGNLPTFNNLVDNGANTGPWINPDYRGTTYYRGYRQYELTNHLGNVLTTISDRKIPVYSGSSLNLPGGFTVPVADYFEPDMVSATDYYPFGMVSRDISPSDITKKYRFGFNGQEMSNDVKGYGNSYTAEFWEYDPRIGQRWNVDPVVDYKISPYATMNNNPIAYNDPNGACATCPKTAKTGERHSELSKEAAGSTPLGGLVFMGNANKQKIHVQYTNIGDETSPNWAVSYFWIEGQDGGWAWSNEKQWYTRKGQEYSQSATMEVTDWGFRQFGKPLTEAAKNALDGRPFKDTKDAFVQYMEEDGRGGVLGFVGSGVKNSLTNLGNDLAAGGHRRDGAIIGLWQFTSGLAKSQIFDGGFSLTKQYMDPKNMSIYIRELELGTPKYPGTTAIGAITENHLRALAENLRLTINKTIPNAKTVQAVQNQIDNPRWMYIDLIHGGRETLNNAIKGLNVTFRY